MRMRDDKKKEAIFQATKELLNEIGFADTSMSKIAKRAGVSPATIYVYFENKDDMLRKLYLDVKRNLTASIAGMLDEGLPIRTLIDRGMRAYLRFITENQEDYLFLEQFANSPLLRNLCIEEEVPAAGALHRAIARGQREGVIRQVDALLLLSYCALPLEQLVKEQARTGEPISETAVETLIEMSWHAIRT